jgi:hypothetical protein
VAFAAAVSAFDSDCFPQSVVTQIEDIDPEERIREQLSTVEAGN